jgi:hypothetical protein
MMHPLFRLLHSASQVGYESIRRLVGDLCLTDNSYLWLPSFRRRPCGYGAGRDLAFMS